VSGSAGELGELRRRRRAGDGADAGAQRSGGSGMREPAQTRERRALAREAAQGRMRARGLRPAFAGEKNMEHKIF